MSVKCVSSACRKKIDPVWHFCPYCGSDNRPPADQEEVPIHTHEYLHGVGYCMLCGEAHDELPGYTGRSRINTATFFLSLSIFLALTLLNIQLAHAGKPAIAQEWIKDWYEYQVRTGRRYSSSSTTDLGLQVSVYLAIGVFFSLLISIRFFFKMQIEEGSPFWDYHDDKPWWRRGRWWR